jgi:hypothetical protein
MYELGYPRYAIQSTDLGWFVAMWMASDSASSVTAHMTDFWFQPPNATDLKRYMRNETTEEENLSIEATRAFQAEDFGYAQVQSTRPLQLALAMTDSPVGWAGWIWQLLVALGDGYDYGYGGPTGVVTTAFF